MVEGLQLLGMAVEVMAESNRVQPREVFYCETLFNGDTAPRLLDALTQAGAEAVPVAENVLNALSDRDTSQGLTATFSLSTLEWPIDRLLAALTGIAHRSAAGVGAGPTARPRQPGHAHPQRRRRGRCRRNFAGAVRRSL